MDRIVHKLIQGTPEWHAHRHTHYNASEAPAMLGVSKYTPRTELVRIKATGDEREVTAAEQERFDDGHAFEAMARPWAEEILGEDLFPVVASLDVDGLQLSASYDGATMAEEIIMEHKSLNRELVEYLTRGEIPEAYKPQMEQQLLILGAKKCLFMASSGNRETMKHAWYESDPDLRKRLLAGWAQFRTDVANYQHFEEAPKAVGATIQALPALTVQIEGRVITSNLVLFRKTASEFIAGINTDLQTDQHFADAEQTVKFCKDGEERLELVKAQALAQTASIDELFRTIDTISEELRAKRLQLNKLVEDRKKSIRAEILAGGQKALAEHIATLNTQLGKAYMPPVPADFAGAMRAKKTIASLRDGVDTELAKAKIAANEVYGRIHVNLNTLREQAKDYAFLFADTALLVLKAPEDLGNTVRLRISEHREAEQKRLDAERERIRKEEAERIEKANAAEQERLRREEAARTAPNPPAPSFADVLHATAPAPIAEALAPRAAAPNVHQIKPKRPTDDEIVATVAAAFRVDQTVALGWLLELDLEAVSDRMTAPSVA